MQFAFKEMSNQEEALLSVDHSVHYKFKHSTKGTSDRWYHCNNRRLNTQECDIKIDMWLLVK